MTDSAPAPALPSCPTDGDARPIGVFDSGVGGLTVLRHLLDLLPQESTVYLGDTARVPYGTRSADTVVRYSRLCARTLVERADVKMLVVACNTVSAVALPTLAAEFQVPVIGVIEPGARAAMQATRGGGIAVLATAGTTRSQAYPQALRALGAQGEILGRACPLLVPLVEEGWIEGAIPMLTLDRYIADLVGRIDVMVLGCTHYPRLRPLLTQMLPSSITVVDGGRATALEARDTLRRSGALAPQGAGSTHRIWVTDAVESMARMAPDFLGSHLPGGLHIDHVELDAWRG
jgi:glutamate racemase